MDNVYCIKACGFRQVDGLGSIQYLSSVVSLCHGAVVRIPLHPHPVPREPVINTKWQ